MREVSKDWATVLAKGPGEYLIHLEEGTTIYNIVLSLAVFYPFFVIFLVYKLVSKVVAIEKQDIAEFVKMIKDKANKPE